MNAAVRTAYRPMVCLAGLVGVLATACSSSQGATAKDAGGSTDASSSTASDSAVTTGDASVSTGGDDSAASVAFLRLAHLSTVLPAVDFCVAAPSGGAFRGPLLGQLAAALSAAGDAGTAGLSYAQVSTYFTVNAATLDVRLVAPNASGCDTPLSLGGDGDAGTGTPLEVDALPAFANGSFVTLLLLGPPASGVDGGTPWTPIVDDGQLTSGNAALRAVNAVPGSAPQDFGFGSFDGGWGPLFTNVPYGAASAQAAPLQPVIDANGYLPVAPFDDQTLSARPSSGATADTAAGTGASVPLGTVASLFAVAAPTSDAGTAASLLLCLDNGTAIGVLSDCALLP